MLVSPLVGGTSIRQTGKWMTEFGSFWRAHYGGCPPLGYHLREAFVERWVRFHSLPESKRYAETEEEMAVILSRANSVALIVLGEGGPCWIVKARYEDEPAQSLPLKLNGAALELDLSFQSDGRDAFFEDEPSAAIYAATATWHAGAFDPLLREIANDQERALWVSVRNAAVFAPYDGGMDIILPTPEEAGTLLDRFSDWKSPYPGGL